MKLQTKGHGLNNHLTEVKASIERITWGFPEVKNKMMFGCESFYFGNNMFIIIWKTGQVGVKITNQKRYESLLKVNGAEPWLMGKMKMDHWVLLPESILGDKNEFFNCVKEAYESVGGTTNVKAPPVEKKQEPVILHKEESEEVKVKASPKKEAVKTPVKAPVVKAKEEKKVVKAAPAKAAPKAAANAAPKAKKPAAKAKAPAKKVAPAKKK